MGLRTFTFAGTSSSAYSMFITEAATYNVPERAVEMLEILGRNGAYALDLGRFQNVEVTYHVVVHATNNSGFQTEFSDVRNWLASQVGYQRLEDDYNSGVYRMAIFKGGLETSEAFVNGAEFDIVFECKPQRWLTSGETAVTVADGGTLSNPTPFEAEPLLAVDGYGDIQFNGYEIEIENVEIGETIIASPNTTANARTLIRYIGTTNMNVGDTFEITDCWFNLAYSTTKSIYKIQQWLVTSPSNCAKTTTYDTAQASVKIVPDSITFAIGTSGSLTATVETRLELLNTTTHSTTTYQDTVTCTITYDGTTELTFSLSSTTPSPMSRTCKIYSPKIYGYSTKSAITGTVYIDCDIGECWTEQSGEIVSLNHLISLGSDLPKLASGTNTFTYDNTVTELNVTPRWWKV